ncbi:aspartate aminotransferase family protein [Chryseobacterium sp. A321]
MKLFEVYSRLPLEIVKAKDCYLWDENGKKYLDFYGGHAVISIGHSHAHYQESLSKQLSSIGFYSNSVQNPLQEKLAELLGRVSGYPDYELFLCNSGAEANENAFKLASFFTGKKKFIAFHGAFHGRTSAAVAATDDPSIVAPVNESENFIFCELNNPLMFSQIVQQHKESLAGVIIEGIQGIGGVHLPNSSMLETIETLAKKHGFLTILDEVQSGYARSGRFFAHQHSTLRPDLITIAKGMGNGFPVGGVLISPRIPSQKKMLGTTFGGNYLACAASIAVLEVIEKEGLAKNAADLGDYLLEELGEIPQIEQVRGRGLMVGIDFPGPVSVIAHQLRVEHGILVGSASDPRTMRLLPPLTINKKAVDDFLHALKQILS